MHFTLQLLYHEVYSWLHKSVGSIWDQVLDEKGCLQRIKNVCTEEYKPICIVVYTCLIVYVPLKPSSYTLVINFLVCMVSIYFLNTRPLQQKNLLNILLMGSLILLSSSSSFISIISYIWNHELKVFVENYPTSVYFLSIRFYRFSLLLLVGLLAFISASRVLLYTRPVVFHVLRSNRMASVAWYIQDLSLKVWTLSPELNDPFLCQCCQEDYLQSQQWVNQLQLQKLET